MWGRTVLLGGLLLPVLMSSAWASADHVCATLPAGDALGALAAMAPEDAHAAALQWDPLYRVWLDDGGLSWLDGDADVARAASRDTCFNPAAVDGHADFALAAESTHFALFRRSGSAPLANTVDALLDSLEDALDRFETLGWRPPGGLDSAQMMVFLEPLPAGLGGYTWVAPCAAAPDGTMDWIVLSEAWAAEEDFRDPLVAHELFHTVQRRYLYTEYVTNLAESTSRWWVEASAVYQEGLVFPDELDLAEERSARWGEAPWTSLFLFDEVTIRHYQVFVFPLSIEGSLDDIGWHRRFWEQLDGSVDVDLRAEFDAFLEPLGTTFDTEFGAYMARASEMDLPRYDYLLGPRDLQAFYGINGGLAGRYAATELPAEGAMEAGAMEGPKGLGGNYVWFGTTAAPEERALELTFVGDLATPEGDPVTWGVEVVAARAGGVELRASVTPAPATVRGEDVVMATVLVHGVKESLDGVWLVATRLDEAGGTAPGWSWEGRLVRGDAELAIEEGQGGCGCGAGAGGSPMIVISLLLLPAMLRRRASEHRAR